MQFSINDFIDFIKSNIFEFPTSIDKVKENPLPPFLTLILLYMLIRGRFRKFFTTLFILIIFLFGYFYGIVQPLDNQTISITIFAFSTLISLVLLIYNFFIKD